MGRGNWAGRELRRAPRRLTRPRAVAIALLCGGLAGCAAIPSFGPAASAIAAGALHAPSEILSETEAETGSETAADAGAENLLSYHLIEVTARTLPVRATGPARFPANLRRAAPGRMDRQIGPGDRLGIRIWEVSDSGLFATAAARETRFDLQVSTSGQITMPYAGTLNVAGQTALQLRSALLARYRGKAIEPEITVAITDAASDIVVVLGDVAAPGQIELPLGGLHLLALLAGAGGVSAPPWEVQVSVQRAGARATLSLADIMARPDNNIIMRAGDVVQVTAVPRRFAVFGGVIRPSNIVLPQAEATLSDLLAEVGGLNARVAAARAVFVFRPADSADGAAAPALAYRLDLSRPDALLLAARFRLLGEDITYVAAAEAADFERVMSLFVMPFLGGAATAAALGE